MEKLKNSVLDKDYKYPKITEYAALNNIKLNKIIKNKRSFLWDNLYPMFLMF